MLRFGMEGAITGSLTSSVTAVTSTRLALQTYTYRAVRFVETAGAGSTIVSSRPQRERPCAKS
jgi:hypothetical protein